MASREEDCPLPESGRRACSSRPGRTPSLSRSPLSRASIARPGSPSEILRPFSVRALGKKERGLGWPFGKKTVPFRRAAAGPAAADREELRPFLVRLFQEPRLPALDPLRKYSVPFPCVHSGRKSEASDGPLGKRLSPSGEQPPGLRQPTEKNSVPFSLDLFESLECRPWIPFGNTPSLSRACTQEE